MKRFSDYNEIPVISGENGALMGKCELIVMPPEDKIISGIRVKPKKWYKRSYYVKIDAVRVFGDVSIIIDTGQDYKAKMEADSPIGLEVLDSSGGLIGYVSDCFFDEESGRVEEMEIRHGLFDDIAYGRTVFKEYSVIELRGEPVFITDYSRLKGVTL